MAEVAFFLGFLAILLWTSWEDGKEKSDKET